MDKTRFPRGVYDDTTERTRLSESEQLEHVSQQIEMLCFLRDHSGVNLSYLLLFLVNHHRSLEELQGDLYKTLNETDEGLEGNHRDIKTVILIDYITEVHTAIKFFNGVGKNFAEGPSYKQNLQSRISQEEELWKPVVRALLLLLDTYTPHIVVSHTGNPQTGLSAKNPTPASSESSQKNVISLDAARRKRRD